VLSSLCEIFISRSKSNLRFVTTIKAKRFMCRHKGPEAICLVCVPFN